MPINSMTLRFWSGNRSLPPRMKEVSRGYSRAQTIGQRIIGSFTADGSLPTRDVVSVLE